MSQILFVMVLQAVIIFAAAGTLSLSRAWIFFGVLLIYYLISGFIVFKLNPEVVKERAEMKKDIKPWDKIFGAAYLLSLIAIPLIAGLDAGRYQWSTVSIKFLVPGLILYILFSMFAQWAIVVNKYFELYVRIQKDRGHKVIMNGPYSIIRHPGYAGIIFQNILFPLIIGSVYAFIPVALLAIFFIIRTELEDKTLQKELEGYKEYTKKVKYRLLPGI